MSQLGFLGDQFIKDPSSCLELDATKDGFWEDIKILDRMANRTTDNILCYYVRCGQCKPSEILSNNNSSLPGDFHEVLSSLGWMIDIKSHDGWSGGVGNNGHVRYWADDHSELAILTPTSPILDTAVNNNNNDQCPRRRVTLASSSSNGPELSRLFMSRRVSKVKNVEVQKVVLVWLENMEDSHMFPVKKMIPNTDAVSLMILLQPLRNKLLLVRTLDTEGEVSRVSPLVDGVTVSPMVAANLIRHTVLNVCRRERLEADSSLYHRKNVLHDIKVKYAVNNNTTVDQIEKVFR